MDQDCAERPAGVWLHHGFFPSKREWWPPAPEITGWRLAIRVAFPAQNSIYGGVRTKQVGAAVDGEGQFSGQDVQPPQADMAMGAGVIKPDRDYNVAAQISGSRPTRSMISSLPDIDAVRALNVYPVDPCRGFMEHGCAFGIRVAFGQPLEGVIHNIVGV